MRRPIFIYERGSSMYSNSENRLASRTGDPQLIQRNGFRSSNPPNSDAVCSSFHLVQGGMEYKLRMSRQILRLIFRLTEFAPVARSMGPEGNSMYSRSGSRCGLCFIIVGLILFSFTGSAAAQGTGSIIGQVTDQSGAVLPGVTVTATSPALQVPQVDGSHERAGRVPAGAVTDRGLSGLVSSWRAFGRCSVRMCG